MIGPRGIGFKIAGVECIDSFVHGAFGYLASYLSLPHVTHTNFHFEVLFLLNIESVPFDPEPFL